MPFPFDNTYARLPNAFFRRIEPTPVKSPVMIRLNDDLAAELGLDIGRLDSPEGLAILSGNLVAEGSEPLAMAYSGHQFGSFSPTLGDGRAILLGEVIHEDGIRYDIQLKGAGQTPYSRRGDGRSALGPVLREFIVSEAMAALGVPTTRALAAVATGENVFREGPTPGGVFTRVARSHIRIGTFQWFAARREHENLKSLADYSIERHYPDVRHDSNPYVELLRRVIERQANLIAHWMQFGFIHGVMNTDNMSISGDTIDYGPCAFMDEFHPEKKFSSIDHQGRYSFSNQGPIGHWNLTRFAETLLPLLGEDHDTAIAEAKASLGEYTEMHKAELERRFAAKIGIADAEPADWSLIESLLTTMADCGADFTLVFRHLRDALEIEDDENVIRQFDEPVAISSWLREWRSRMSDVDPRSATALMRRVNPVLIPRNHRVEEVIEAAYDGDFTPFHRLHDALRHPFDVRPDLAEYEAAPTTEEVVHATFCGT